MLRRLFSEVYIMASADLRIRVEHKEDDVPKRLPKPERIHRDKEKQTRLSCIALIGKRECSHALIDMVVSMAEEDQLGYVKWEACTKRDQELMGQRVDPVWRPDKDGIVREVRVGKALKADMNKDLRSNVRFNVGRSHSAMRCL